MFTFLVGGVRSGKTTLATDIARRHGGSVTYLATAPRIPDDADLEGRIETHRAERPGHWVTVEEELAIATEIEAAESDVVVVDCLTTWVANQLHHGAGHDEVRSAASEAAATCARSTARVVVVSNELGMGIHPTSELGRRYRDLLGWVNQEFARHADQSLLLVAGRALPLTDPWTHLP
jgi:adenosyl cobinamide kinase/adenosyl cobinamide phosphate guanylyltransferase